MRLKRGMLLAVMGVMVMLLVGCKTTGLKPNATMTFAVPSKLSVIRPKSNVRLLSYESTGFPAHGLADELARQLNKAGQFRVNRGGPYEYVINLSVFAQHRFDSKNEAHYNSKVIKKKVESKSGGHEVMIEERARTAQSALIATVSIYEIKHLRPLAYFNVAGIFSQWQKDGKGLMSGVNAERKLAKEIVDNIRNQLVTGKRKVGVIMPSGGDSAAKDLLLKGKPRAAMKLLKPKLPPVDVVQLRKSMYANWAKLAEKAKAEGRPYTERDMEKDLSNLYLYLMAKESASVSAAGMEYLHDGYEKILALTDDQSLVDACSHSMARVETNAGRLGLKLVEE